VMQSAPRFAPRLQPAACARLDSPSLVVMKLQVNGRVHDLALPDETLLVDALRDPLRLTGTHVGCDTAQCGACTVLIDGRAGKACNLLARQVEGCEITTVEGLSCADGTLHPMQRAFVEQRALQCGYCTPGMVMRCVAMHGENIERSEDAVSHALSGNLCRCTGYQPIVRAALQGLAEMDAR
jgi:aerobic carbon-monoxide dehydrogenase small subunit